MEVHAHVDQVRDQRPVHDVLQEAPCVCKFSGFGIFRSLALQDLLVERLRSFSVLDAQVTVHAHVDQVRDQGTIHVDVLQEATCEVEMQRIAKLRCPALVLEDC